MEVHEALVLELGAQIIRMAHRHSPPPRAQRLANGDVGYLMAPNRPDDCLRAAVATVLQVPIEEVPDPRLDERMEAGEDPANLLRSMWEGLERWAEDRGLRIRVHAEVPPRRRRWIGIVVKPDRVWFTDHCLCMDRGELYFDPALGVKCPPGMRLIRYEPEDIAYGISFERRRNGRDR